MPAPLLRISTMVARFAALAVLATACGDDLGASGIPLDIDRSHFSTQRFFCPPAGPSCPPWWCAVDETGRVVECDEGRCAADDSTVFEAPYGYSLCVPDRCTVSAEGAPPSCSDTCADDQTTRYELFLNCR